VEDFIKRYSKYIIIGLLTGVLNGLFGSGGGTIAVPSMVFLLGADDHKAHATAILIILPLTIVSSLFYVSNNYVDWDITIKVILGGVIGGYIGARVLHVCPANLLRKIFAIFMLAGAVKMII